MHPIRKYFNEAIKNEEVFRNILRSLEKEGLNSDAPLKEIFEEYSTGSRYGKWTILNFRRGPYEDSMVKLSENEALFTSEDIALLSGSGRADKYKVKEDKSVEFDSNVSFWKSQKK